MDASVLRWRARFTARHHRGDETRTNIRGNPRLRSARARSARSWRRWPRPRRGSLPDVVDGRPARAASALAGWDLRYADVLLTDCPDPRRDESDRLLPGLLDRNTGSCCAQRRAGGVREWKGAAGASRRGDRPVRRRQLRAGGASAQRALQRMVQAIEWCGLPRARVTVGERAELTGGTAGSRRLFEVWIPHVRAGCSSACCRCCTSQRPHLLRAAAAAARPAARRARPTVRDQADCASASASGCERASGSRPTPPPARRPRPAAAAAPAARAAAAARARGRALPALARGAARGVWCRGGAGDLHARQQHVAPQRLPATARARRSPARLLAGRSCCRACGAAPGTGAGWCARSASRRRTQPSLACRWTTERWARGRHRRRAARGARGAAAGRRGFPYRNHAGLGGCRVATSAAQLVASSARPPSPPPLPPPRGGALPRENPAAPRCGPTWPVRRAERSSVALPAGASAAAAHVVEPVRGLRESARHAEARPASTRCARRAAGAAPLFFTQAVLAARRDGRAAAQRTSQPSTCACGASRVAPRVRR